MLIVKKRDCQGWIDSLDSKDTDKGTEIIKEIKNRKKEIYLRKNQLSQKEKSDIEKRIMSQLVIEENELLKIKNEIRNKQMCGEKFTKLDLISIGYKIILSDEIINREILEIIKRIVEKV